MHKILVLFTGLFLALVMAATPPSGAATGQMTFTEFGNIVLGEYQNGSGGVLNVEDDCGCTGNVINTWHTSDGYNHKDVRYFAPQGSYGIDRTAVIRYRALGDSVYHARRKVWCQGIASSFSDPDCTEYNMPTN